MHKTQKVQVIIYFSCSSLLRKEGKITMGNETLVVVLSSLVTHFTDIYER